jgi:hypothetical protein
MVVAEAKVVLSIVPGASIHKINSLVNSLAISFVLLASRVDLLLWLSTAKQSQIVVLGIAALQSIDIDAIFTVVVVQSIDVDTMLTLVQGVDVDQMVICGTARVTFGSRTARGVMLSSSGCRGRRRGRICDRERLLKQGCLSVFTVVYQYTCRLASVFEVGFAKCFAA